MKNLATLYIFAHTRFVTKQLCFILKFLKNKKKFKALILVF